MQEVTVSPRIYLAIQQVALDYNWPLNAYYASRDAGGYAVNASNPFLGAIDSALTCEELTYQERCDLTNIANLIQSGPGDRYTYNFGDGTSVMAVAE